MAFLAVISPRSIFHSPLPLFHFYCFFFQTTADTVVWGRFCPSDPTVLITYGKEHIYFWKLTSDNKLVRDNNSGRFTEQFPLPKFLTAAVFLNNGDLVTGDSNGSLLYWTRDSDQNYKINPTMSKPLTNVHKVKFHNRNEKFKY